MKKANVSKLMMSLLAPLAVVASGSVLAAGIANTKHNLSNSSNFNTVAGAIYSTDQTEICIFCHTPHDAIKNNNIPLWNHMLSTVGSYGVYQSPTFNGVAADVGGASTDGKTPTANAAASNLCLSCHDGTVAINSFNNPSNQNPTTTMAISKIPSTSSTNLGSDLTNDHPVNFTYDTNLMNADKGTAATASLIDPGAGAAGLAGSNLPNGVKLFGGKVQCASCHDPHQSADPSGRSFLRASMVGSTLCLSCHIK